MRALTCFQPTGRPGPERGRRVSAATAVLVVLSGVLVLPGQLAAASPAEPDSAPLTEAENAALAST